MSMSPRRRWIGRRGGVAVDRGRCRGSVQWQPRRAGVSSFGISGTNAHVILEEAPPRERGPPVLTATRPRAFAAPAPVPHCRSLLSGKSERALRGQAERLRTHVEDSPELELRRCRALAGDRPVAFEHRAVVLGASVRSCWSGLVLLAAESAAAHVSRALCPRAPARTAFLFTGQGAQRAGWAGSSYEAFPVFGDALGRGVRRT